MLNITQINSIRNSFLSKKIAMPRNRNYLIFLRLFIKKFTYILL